VRLGLRDCGLVREPPRDGGVGTRRRLVQERDIAAILRFLAVELAERFRRATTLRGEEADEDLLAQRGRPARTARQPRAERPLAARGQAEDAPEARPRLLVAARDQAASLELVQELVDLPDVRMPERSDPVVEALQELVAVSLAIAEQRQQRVS
jgi:hypothetical protein